MSSKQVRPGIPRSKPRSSWRWPLRIAAILLLVIVAGLLVATQFVEPWLQELAGRLAVDKADSELKVAELQISWRPLGVSVSQASLTLRGETHPWAAVEGLTAEVDLGELLRGRVQVREVVAERPVLALRVREDGTLALPSFAGDGGGSRFELESLRLEEGEVRWHDGRLPLHATLTGLRGESTPVDGSGIAVLFDTDSLNLEIAGGQIAFAIDGEVTWDGAGVGLQRLRAQHPLLGANISGTFAEGDGTLAVEVDGNLAAFAAWLGDEAPLDGSATLTAEVSNTDPRAAGVWVVTGDGQIEDLHYQQLQIDRLPVEFEVIDGEFAVDSGDIRAWGGSWRSSFLLVEDEARVELKGSGASLQQLAGDFGWGATVPGGTLGGNLVYQFDPGRWQQGTGTAEVTLTPGAWGGTWLSTLSLADREVDLVLNASGVSLDQLASSLGMTTLKRGATLGGSLEYRFDLSQWDQGRGTAGVTLTPGGSWTLAGSAPIEIRPGLLLSLTGSIGDNSTQAILEGELDSTLPAGEIEFRVQTGDVVELQDLIGLSGDFLPTSGYGSLDGRLILGASTSTITLSANLRDLELSSLSADSATATLTLAEGGLTLDQAELVRDGTAAGGHSARLAGSGNFPADGRGILLDATAANWPVEQLLPLASIDLPVTGLASGSVGLQINAPPDGEASVDGEIAVTLARAAYDGTEVAGSIAAPIRILDGAVDIADGLWSTSGGDLRFAAGIDPGGGWQVNAEGKELQVVEMLPGLEILGQGYRASIDLAARGGDEFESADLVVTTRTQDNEPKLLTGTVSGGRIEVTGDVAGIAYGVEISGSFSESGPDVIASGVIELTDWVDQPELELDGSMRLGLQIEGSWQEPVVIAEGSAVEVSVAGQTLREIEPVRAVLRSGVVELESAYIQNPRTGGEVFVAGTMDLASQALDGVVQADLDAVWLHALVPELTTTGALSFLGNVLGTIAEPILDGQGQWSDGTAGFEGFPHTLRDISLRFLTGSEGIVVDRAQADLDGGTLTATGSLDVDSERGVSYSARLAAQAINVNFPEDWWIGGDATVRIQGDATSRLVSGDVSLERAVLLESIDLSVEQLLRAAFQRQREWVASTDEFLRSTRLQLQVSGSDALRVSGEGLDLTGDIDLSIGGDLASPLVLGQVDLSAGGEIVFRSNDFEIERGVLLFSNPHVIDPEIDLVAISQVRNYDVRLHLQGTLESMGIEFTSEPALPSLEVVSLLTTGQVGRQPLLLEHVTASTTQSAAAEGLLAGQAAEVVGARVGRLFGLDRVQVDPLTESSGSLSSARITVGKRLSDDVVATYSYDPTDSEEQVVQLDWQLTPAVAVVLTQNGDGSYAVDFKWQQSF